VPKLDKNLKRNNLEQITRGHRDKQTFHSVVGIQDYSFSLLGWPIGLMSRQLFLTDFSFTINHSIK